MGTNKRERQKANRQLRLEELAKQARRNRSRRYAFIVGGIVVGVIALIGVIQLFTDDSTTTADTTTTAVTTTVPGPTTTAAPLPDFVYGTGDCAPDDGADQKGPFAAAPKLCIDPTKTYTATFITTEGTIEVALDAADLPGTVNNFVNLSRFGYYNDSKIFRADPSLDIIQGGGLTNTDSPGYTIPDEANGFTYQEGDLVMARTGQADSAGAQFFFVGGPNGANLDNQGTYVTFGHVTKGIEVVKAILGLAGADGQTPTRDVTVTSITITESDTPTDSTTTSSSGVPTSDSAPAATTPDTVTATS